MKNLQMKTSGGKGPAVQFAPKSEILAFCLNAVHNARRPAIPFIRGRAYKAKGEKAVLLDSIRINGSREFVEAVLARVADVVTEMEGAETLASVQCRQMCDKETGTPLDGQFAFYGHAQVRGDEGAMLQVRMRGNGGFTMPDGRVLDPEHPEVKQLLAASKSPSPKGEGLHGVNRTSAERQSFQGGKTK